MTARARRLLHDSLVAAGEEQPGRTAVVADGHRHSYGELLDSARRLARALQDRGVRRGDRVAIYMENGWPPVVAAYATWLAGGVVMLVNPQTKTDKLAYMLADSEATALVSEEQLAPVFRQALRDAPGVRALFCADDAPSGDGGTPGFGSSVGGHPAAPVDSGVIPIDLAALIYTSGSTGNPKGVMLTHQNMVFAVGSISEYLRLTADDRILNVLPLAFDYGLYQLLMTVSLGATCVLERSFAYPGPVLERARQERVTVFPIVPTIGATLLALRKRTGLTLPSVARVTNTAAALPAGYLPGLRAIFPHALIFAMYGLTECKRVSYLEPELLDVKPTSVGKAIPGTEVFLLSPEGRPVPPGVPGILHVRGPHVMLGYWKQPELSGHMLKEGRYPGERVLCTHDYFTMDEEGFLHFVGRTDDIIKTRGEKVSPAEVEDVLHRIDGVREAAVVGVPDEALGEAVRAYVVPEVGAALTEKGIRQACMARLESFMVPREVMLVSELPKTMTGKVRKEELRQRR